MHIAIVFNPRSGIRASAHRLSDVVAALASHNHTLTVIDCKAQPDFEREIRDIAPSTDRVIVIGGDGTLGGTINAVATSENPGLPVAFVPTGRGKDTARTLPSWTASEMAGGRFELAECLPTDLIKATLQTGIERYSINISSIGVGAQAAAVANKLPRLLGSLSYVLAAARTLVPPPNFPLTFTVDGKEQFVSNALMIGACNGKSFGGGIHIAPEADPGDGLMDVVVVQNANLLDLLKQLGKLKSGTLHDHPALLRWQAKVLTIEPARTDDQEADGEALSAQPHRYKIAPGALNWVTPQ